MLGFEAVPGLVRFLFTQKVFPRIQFHNVLYRVWEMPLHIFPALKLLMLRENKGTPHIKFLIPQTLSVTSCVILLNTKDINGIYRNVKVEM